MIKKHIYYQYIETENGTEIDEENLKIWVSSDKGWPIECVDTEEIFPHGFTIIDSNDETSFIELEPENDLPLVLFLDVPREMTGENLLLQLSDLWQQNEQTFRCYVTETDEVVWLSSYRCNLMCFFSGGIPNNIAYYGLSLLIDPLEETIEKINDKITNLAIRLDKYLIEANSHPKLFYNPNWIPKPNLPNIVCIAPLGSGAVMMQTTLRKLPYNIYTVTNGYSQVEIPNQINMVLALNDSNLNWIQYSGPIENIDLEMTTDQIIRIIEQNIGESYPFSLNN